MHPGIGIESMGDLDPVAMPDRNVDRHYGSITGSADRFETSSPQPAHGCALLAHTTVLFVQYGKRRACIRRQIRPKTRQRWRFLQNPGELLAFRLRDAVQY